MQFRTITGWGPAARAVLLAFATAFALVACGGGGGDDSQDAPPAITGNWQLTLTAEGSTSTPVAVSASAVPTEQQVSAITTASVAQVFATTAFQGMTITVNGATVTITGSGTNYTLVINSISTSNYQGCGACGVGTKVSYNVNMNYTESGTFQGQSVPTNTDSLLMTFTYTRTS